LQDPCSDPKPLAEQLYKLLILPIQKDLDGAAAKTIVWELDGALRYIPLSALYDGHTYVAEKYSTVLFTASHETGLTAEVRVGDWRALGMGSSQAHVGLDPLAAVPDELEGIIHDTEDPKSKGPVPGRILLDSGFTPQAMKDQLRAGFPIVHIASHFVLKPGSDESFLVLGAPDPGEPGSDRITFAQLRDTPSYRFNHIQLLTLSACETGAGGGTRDQGGKEIDSLGILSASRGANSALATLWSVSDASTGRLMVNFYRHWTSGNTLKVEALRQAQMDMLHAEAPVAAYSSCKVTEAHPFFWAPFILIGNWQ
jgi:CHAT domain-containing protein